MKSQRVWFAYPRMFLLQLAACGLWLLSAALLAIADVQSGGEHFGLLFRQPGLNKVVPLLWFVVPASFFAASQNYRLAAWLAGISGCGALVLSSNASCNWTLSIPWVLADRPVGSPPPGS